MNNELIMDLQNLKQNWKELEGASKEKIISLVTKSSSSFLEFKLFFITTISIRHWRICV